MDGWGARTGGVTCVGNGIGGISLFLGKMITQSNTSVVRRDGSRLRSIRSRNSNELPGLSGTTYTSFGAPGGGVFP
jgi:hypothetical protein